MKRASSVEHTRDICAGCAQLRVARPLDLQNIVEIDREICKIGKIFEISM
jgi:hypothetical protein